VPGFGESVTDGDGRPDARDDRHHHEEETGHVIIVAHTLTFISRPDAVAT
jgi:hypothetical protein